MKLSLAQNISRLRKESGMTQERLAETLGVSFAAVSKWERGAATPELGLIVEMADLFGVSVDALLGYEEIFITSFDSDVLGLHEYLGEYENIDELNYLAVLLSDMDQSRGYTYGPNLPRYGCQNKIQSNQGFGSD